MSMNPVQAVRASRSVVLITGLSLSALAFALFYTGQDAVFYSASILLLMVALLIGIWRHGAPQRLSIGSAGLCLLALFLWSAAATFWSSVPYLTHIASGVIGAAFLHYLVWRQLDPLGRGLIMGVFCALLTGLAIAVTMLVQIALGQRPVATFLNPNTAAGFLNLLWPVAAALSLHPRPTRRQRTALLTVVATMIFALTFDGSRAAMLALLAAIAVLFVGGVRLAGCARLARLAAVILGSVLLAQTVAALVPDGRGPGADRLASLTDPAAAGASRLRIWDAAIEMIGERPLLGYGPGTFFQAYPPWRPPDDGSAAFHVHNDYLQYWVEGGLPALLLLLLLFLVCAWRLLRVSSAQPLDSRFEAARLAVGAAVAGCAIHALFSYNLQVLPYLVVLGGLLAALDAADSGGVALSFPLGGVRRRLLPAIALGGAMLLPATHVAAIGLSHYHTDQAMAHIGADEAEAAHRSFRRARQLWDAPDAAWTFHADLYRRLLRNVAEERTDLRREMRERAFELIDGATARNPLRAHAHAIRGEILMEPPDADSGAAEAAFRRALTMNPRYVRARVALIGRLRARGAEEEAHDVLVSGLAYTYGRRNPLPLFRAGIALADARGSEDMAVRLRERLEAYVEAHRSRS